MSCRKSREFLEGHGLQAGEEEEASKVRRGREQALGLAKSVANVVAARGKRLVTFDMKAAPPEDEVLLAHILGPTGNLRAPTLRLGNTLLVGFSVEAYKQVLGL